MLIISFKWIYIFNSKPSIKLITVVGCCKLFTRFAHICRFGFLKYLSFQRFISFGHCSIGKILILIFATLGDIFLPSWHSLTSHPNNSAVVSASIISSDQLIPFISVPSANLIFRLVYHNDFNIKMNDK